MHLATTVLDGACVRLLVGDWATLGRLAVGYWRHAVLCIYTMPMPFRPRILQSAFSDKSMIGFLSLDRRPRMKQWSQRIVDIYYYVNDCARAPWSGALGKIVSTVGACCTYTAYECICMAVGNVGGIPKRINVLRKSKTTKNKKQKSSEGID